MTYQKAFISAAVLSIALPNTVLAEINEGVSDTITIEGSRLNQTQTEVGTSVSVITVEDLKVLDFDFVLDAIASVPGVTINQNGAFGGAASIRIRGAASEQTLVLIDGVPVNDPTSPGGGFDFARLDTDNIERIEVLKGPQSTLWGTDAIGGVVSIITKRAEQGLGGAAFAEYGSFDTFRGGASLEHGSERGDLRLAVVRSTSNGISKADEDNGNTEEDEYDALTLSAKGGLNLGGDFRLSADVLWTDASLEFDSFIFGAQGDVADGDEESETEELSLNGSLTGSLFDGRLENLLLIGYSDISRENFTNNVPGFSSEGERLIYRYQGTVNVNEQHTLAFGAEREETSANGQDTSINGFFGLYEFKPIDELTITGGVRIDDHQRFGNETTGRVAAAYNPSEQITLRASWGQGFKAPTIFQTTFFCCGAVAPNADLEAETSQAFDVGMDWRSPDGRAQAGVTYFNQDIENQIDFSFAVGGYENIAVVESQGVEVYASYALTQWLNIAADYAFIDSQDGAGNELSRIPEHSADVTIALDPQGPFSGALLVRYNGAEQNTDGTTLDSWTRVDLTGRYQLNEHFELFGRVENLFDADYQQVLGYGTPRISGSIGVRARY